MGSVSGSSVSTMKVFALILLVAAVSAKDIRIQVNAPPTELEHGFCPGSPEPFTLDALSVKPFPIIIANGESVTLELQLTLNEEIAKGAQVSLKMKLEGLIDLPIPCIEVDGLHIGSCDYDADTLLAEGAPILCPDHFPDGQACTVAASPLSSDPWRAFLTPSRPSSREQSTWKLRPCPPPENCWLVFGSEPS